MYRSFLSMLFLAKDCVVAKHRKRHSRPYPMLSIWKSFSSEPVSVISLLATESWVRPFLMERCEGGPTDRVSEQRLGQLRLLQRSGVMDQRRCAESDLSSPTTWVPRASHRTFTVTGRCARQCSGQMPSMHACSRDCSLGFEVLRIGRQTCPVLAGGRRVTGLVRPRASATWYSQSSRHSDREVSESNAHGARSRDCRHRRRSHRARVRS